VGPGVRVGARQLFCAGRKWYRAPPRVAERGHDVHVVKIDRRLLALLALVGALGLLAAYGLPLFRDSEPGAIDPVAFQKTMRELWTDHCSGLS